MCYCNFDSRDTRVPVVYQISGYPQSVQYSSEVLGICLVAISGYLTICYFIYTQRTLLFWSSFWYMILTTIVLFAPLILSFNHYFESRFSISTRVIYPVYLGMIFMGRDIWFCFIVGILNQFKVVVPKIDFSLTKDLMSPLLPFLIPSLLLDIVSIYLITSLHPPIEWSPSLSWIVVVLQMVLVCFWSFLILSELLHSQSALKTSLDSPHSRSLDQRRVVLLIMTRVLSYLFLGCVCGVIGVEGVGLLFHNDLSSNCLLMSLVFPSLPTLLIFLSTSLTFLIASQVIPLPHFLGDLVPLEAKRSSDDLVEDIREGEMLETISLDEEDETDEEEIHESPFPFLLDDKDLDEINKAIPFCVETALHLIEASYQAYNHYEDVRNDRSTSTASSRSSSISTHSTSTTPVRQRSLSQSLNIDLSGLGLKVLSGVSNTTHEIHAFFGVDSSRLIISFRGSSSFQNILTDISIFPKLPSSILKGEYSDDIQVHGGFLDAYDSVKDEIGNVFLNALELHPSITSIQITGHRSRKINFFFCYFFLF